MARSRSLADGLARTRRSFFGRIADLFRQEITAETWEELETLLIQGDVGVETTGHLLARVRARVESDRIKSADSVQALLRDELLGILTHAQRPYLAGERQLNVVLVVGVNGSGKTTSIAKLARYHTDLGQKTVLAAADTYRAAAIEQLQVWGRRVGVDVIAHQPRADPGAVVYDAIRACQARDADVLIVDTAGRLQTQHNLMLELAKISGIARKQVHQAPHETLLVLDATTGQNALSQARVFTQMVGVTGVVLAKLDGTAKGGMVFAISNELKLPVLFAATGESVDDWAPFDPAEFVAGLFEAA